MKNKTKRIKGIKDFLKVFEVSFQNETVERNKFIRKFQTNKEDKIDIYTVVCNLIQDFSKSAVFNNPFRVWVSNLTQNMIRNLRGITKSAVKMNDHKNILFSVFFIFKPSIQSWHVYMN